MINIADFRKHAGARATGLNFISSGLIFGTWAAMIPFIKVKFQLDEAELGLLLLAPPAGIMMANPLSVYVMRKFGAVRTSLGAMALAALALAANTHRLALFFGGSQDLGRAVLDRCRDCGNGRGSGWP